MDGNFGPVVFKLIRMLSIFIYLGIDSQNVAIERAIIDIHNICVQSSGIIYDYRCSLSMSTSLLAQDIHQMGLNCAALKHSSASTRGLRLCRIKT